METVKLLLENGAKINMRDEEIGDTPLYNAIGDGHADVVRLLVERGADVNAPMELYGTPLAYAAKTAADVAQYIKPLPEKYMDTIRFLMARGADVRRVPAKQLKEVAKYGGSAVLNLLLDSGESVNGDVLNAAAGNCALATVKRIMAKGVNASEETLDAAIKGGNDEVFHHLLSQGMRPKADKENLAKALGSGSVEISKYFISKGVKLDKGLAQAALEHAAECNYADMFKFSLGKGASAQNGELLCKAVQAPSGELLKGEGYEQAFLRASIRNIKAHTELAKSATSTIIAIKQMGEDAISTVKYAPCTTLCRASKRAPMVKDLINAGAAMPATCSGAYMQKGESKKYTGALLDFVKKQSRQGDEEIIQMLKAAGARE